MPDPKTHSTLTGALAAFQATMPTVTKGKTAKVPTKAGGSYSYSYADLADVSQAVMPLLAAQGLAFTVGPRFADGEWIIEATLAHTSGETITGALPLFGRSPQEIGSSLTYARRYLLGCLTGVVTDDDDDAQAANTAQRARSTRQPVKDWRAIIDTASALTDESALRALWTSESVDQAPGEIRAAFNARVAAVRGDG